MTSIFHPQAVNDSFGDPAVYVDFLFEKRALLFDLGDIQLLPARKILRLTHIFVSHTHMDHFIGFDHILRTCIGRARNLALFGPPGFIDQVAHKLAAYTWNLVTDYATDFTLVANEWQPSGELCTASFRSRSRFRREDEHSRTMQDGVLLNEENIRVRAAVLDHRIPCLGFALEEKQHINVWKNRLFELGLPTGPWLQELKSAVRRGDSDDSLFCVWWKDRLGRHERMMPLGHLRREVIHMVPGQKIAYVVDIIHHAENVRRVCQLVRAADVLFVEAAFLHEDAGHAARKYHLTARQAGEIARAAGVRRLEPIHFSTRYSENKTRIYREVQTAFAGATSGRSGTERHPCL